MNSDPLRPHSHNPNPLPPHEDPALVLHVPSANRHWTLTPADLATLPQTTVPGCRIVSTGHGTTGPFIFGGVALADLVAAYFSGAWQDAEVVSADGFGSRVYAGEALDPSGKRPVLLATHIDGRPMSREEGLVRLIVPSERDDALRQVKWIATITVNG